jgi:hypothetical protein
LPCIYYRGSALQASSRRSKGAFRSSTSGAEYQTLPNEVTAPASLSMPRRSLSLFPHHQAFSKHTDDDRICSLRQICKYGTSVSSVASDSTATASPCPGPEVLPIVGVFTPADIKAAIIQRLSPIKPKDVASTYFSTIEPWFPVIAETRLCVHPRCIQGCRGARCLRQVTDSVYRCGREERGMHDDLATRAIFWR